MTYRKVLESDLVGKTISSINSDSVNVLYLNFTDGSKLELWADTAIPFAVGDIPGIFVEESLGNIVEKFGGHLGSGFGVYRMKNLNNENNGNVEIPHKNLVYYQFVANFDTEKQLLRFVNSFPPKKITWEQHLVPDVIIDPDYDDSVITLYFNIWLTEK